LPGCCRRSTEDAIRRKIRAKRLGIALQDARRLAGRKPQECEEALGIPAKTLRAYERGTRAPSVPELAALAYFYQVPMEHFWGTEIRSDDPLPLSSEQIQTLMEEYHRTIAARLKAAREEKGLTLRELARKTGLSTAKLRKYEEGTQPVPVPDLEVLASELDLSLNALFREAPGPLGDWIRYQQRLQGSAQAFARAAAAYQAQGEAFQAAVAQGNQGVALLHAGQVDAALALLAPLPARFARWRRPREEALSWGNLALALERAGRRQEALEAYRRSLEGLAALGEGLREEQAAVHRGLARVHVRMGRWREALGHMMQAFLLAPRTPLERLLRFLLLRVARPTPPSR